jgi:hypothetical protein
MSDRVMCIRDTPFVCEHGVIFDGTVAPPKGTIRTINIESVAHPCHCPTYVLTTGESGHQKRFTRLIDLDESELFEAMGSAPICT